MVYTFVRRPSPPCNRYRPSPFSLRRAHYTLNREDNRVNDDDISPIIIIITTMIFSSSSSSSSFSSFLFTGSLIAAGHWRGEKRLGRWVPPLCVSAHTDTRTHRHTLRPSLTEPSSWENPSVGRRQSSCSQRMFFFGLLSQRIFWVFPFGRKRVWLLSSLRLLCRMCQCFISTKERRRSGKSVNRPRKLERGEI